MWPLTWSLGIPPISENLPISPFRICSFTSGGRPALLPPAMKNRVWYFSTPRPWESAISLSLSDTSRKLTLTKFLV